MAAAKKKTPNAKSANAKSAKATPAKATSARGASKPGKKVAKAGTQKVAKKAAKVASKAASSKGTKAKPNAKSGATVAAKATKIDPAALFALGVDLSRRGFLFDAIAAFRDASKAAPKNELADDALVNIGLCSLKMGMYADAIDAFTRVITEYPDATIAEIDEGEEHGRTAAKALYGRVRAKAAIGDFAGAKADVEALAPYDDAYVVDEASADRVTFHALANGFLTSLEG